MADIGEHIKDLAVRGSLLGQLLNRQAITGASLYAGGLTLKNAQGEEVYPFERIGRIIAREHFVPPEPPTVQVTLYNALGQKIAALYFGMGSLDWDALLEAHSRYTLGPDFPANLRGLEVDLGGEQGDLRLKNCQLTWTYKGKTTTFGLNQVAEYVHRMGKHYLVMRPNGEKLYFDPTEAPNAVSAVAVARALAARGCEPCTTSD